MMAIEMFFVLAFRAYALTITLVWSLAMVQVILPHARNLRKGEAGVEADGEEGPRDRVMDYLNAAGYGEVSRDNESSYDEVTDEEEGTIPTLVRLGLLIPDQAPVDQSADHSTHSPL